MTQRPLPEKINCPIDDRGRGEDRNPDQGVFKVDSSGGEVNQISGQRFGETTCSNEPATGSIYRQAGNCPNDQRRPSVSLEGDINNDDQRKVDVRKGRPCLAEGELEDDGEGEHRRNLKLGHYSKSDK